MIDVSYRRLTNSLCCFIFHGGICMNCSYGVKNIDKCPVFPFSTGLIVQIRKFGRYSPLIVIKS